MTQKEHQFEGFRLDPVNQCLWQGAYQISLSPKAFAVLHYLAERPGRLVTKQELLDAVWPDIHVTEGVLKRAVLEIRKSLGDPVDEPRFIHTLHRRGYRFLSTTSDQKAPVEQLPEHPGVVGRSKEFLQLDEWFEDAVGSSRQIVFITGEAGLGKTTLVDNWMRSLRQQRAGVAVARGRCLQQFGSGEPYLPVFEALDQLSKILGRRLAEVLRERAPTWLLHMPALISLEDRVKLRDEVFGSTRERMLREITDALEVLSTETPLVIALEDLHWSDPSTLDLLSSVARRTGPARLMILGTYRPAEAGGALLGLQNELELHSQCKVLPLRYLSESDTCEYLTARFPDMDSTETLATALHQRTNGNPLYVVCLVEELARSGHIEADPATIRKTVPSTLQQMFERQASQLGQAEQAMLDAAAIAGEAFSVASVAAALELDGGELESRCEGLVRRQVILKRGASVRYPDGAESSGYSFVHALCRDALSQRIPHGRRSRLHGLLGQADERLYAADPKRIAGELAGHFELAGDFARTIRYLRMAAEGAAARYSNQEAAGYVDRAFEMVERLRDTDRAPCRMDLLEQRALMRLAASDMPGAVKDFKALAEVARLAGAVDRQTNALLDLAYPLLFVDFRKAVAVIDEAHALRTGAIVDLYRAFFQVYLFGWTAELAETFRGALTRTPAGLDLRIQGRIVEMESCMHLFVAEYAAAAERAEESRQYCRKIGVFYGYFIATLYLHWAHLHRGDLGQAMRVAKDGAELAARNGSYFPQKWLTMRQVWVQMEAFDFESARPVCEALAVDPLFVSYGPNRAKYVWVGMARCGAGDYDGALDALENLRQAIAEGGVPFFFSYLQLHTQVECEVGRKHLAEAKTLAVQLVAFARKYRESSYAARGLRLLAEIAGMEGDFELAADYVSQAMEALDQCEAWTVEWRVHATAAQVSAKLGRQWESDERRAHSLRVAQRIADTLSDEPGLQQSFLRRVEGDLAARSTSA